MHLTFKSLTSELDKWFLPYSQLCVAEIIKINCIMNFEKEIVAPEFSHNLKSSFPKHNSFSLITSHYIFKTKGNPGPYS